MSRLIYKCLKVETASYLSCPNELAGLRAPARRWSAMCCRHPPERAIHLVAPHHTDRLSAVLRSNLSTREDSCDFFVARWGARSSAKRGPLIAWALKMSHVLVVDDDVDFVQTSALMLRHGGYTVITAGSIGAAIATMDRTLPDAILLDWKLPDGTALDLLRWMRARRACVPTALITGFWADPDFAGAYAQARSIGVAEYIRRGIDSDEPTDIVRRLLDPLGYLHAAVLRGEESANEGLASELRLRLFAALQFRYRSTPDDTLSDAVTDAIMEHLSHPRRFDPTRHVSIERFVALLARRRLSKLLRTERRDRTRNQEYGRLRGTIVESGDRLQRLDGRRLLAQAISMESEPLVRSAIREWLAGNHSSEPWAAIPSIRDLPPHERSAEIKRRKDCFIARSKRLRPAR